MNLRKTAAVAALTLGIGVGATACGSSPASYDTMCVNPATQFRMDDYYCQAGNPLYNPLWIYYVRSGYNAPGVGVHVNNYTVNNFHAPSGRVRIHQGGVPTSGGKVTKYQAPKSNTGGVTRQKSPTYKAPTYKAPSIKTGR
jgi:hypothetical protein